MSLDKPYVVALVPARSGSKGVKNKNLRTVHGKSLLDWSIRAGKEALRISRVVVSTNSSEYAEIAKKAGAEVPFLRPDSISQDKSTDFEFVSHALDFFYHEGQIPDQAISDGFKRKEGVTSMRSVHEMSESSYKSFEIGESGNLVSAFSKSHELDSANAERQSFPKTYSPNGYIDLLYPDFILNSGTLHGNNALPIFTENTIEIDSEPELNMAQALASMNPVIFTRIFGD